MNSLEIAETAVEALKEKKAQDIKVLDLRKITTFCDFFVIATGTSDIHVKSLADYVEEKLDEKGVKLDHREGYRSGRWILLDYKDVVIHIFYKEERNFYNLERLWIDAEEISIE